MNVVMYEVVTFLIKAVIAYMVFATTLYVIVTILCAWVWKRYKRKGGVLSAYIIDHVKDLKDSFVKATARFIASIVISGTIIGALYLLRFLL
jgi:hypothetical protein